jgi:glutamine cyclotransferase
MMVTLTLLVLLLTINLVGGVFRERAVGRYNILEEWAHDSEAFTQGFVVHKGIL